MGPDIVQQSGGTEFADTRPGGSTFSHQIGRHVTRRPGITTPHMAATRHATELDNAAEQYGIKYGEAAGPHGTAHHLAA
jgi:hypothetical protein